MPLAEPVISAVIVSPYLPSSFSAPLILLHGNTSCGKMFDQIVPKLAEKYRVIVIDLPAATGIECPEN